MHTKSVFEIVLVVVYINFMKDFNLPKNKIDNGSVEYVKETKTRSKSRKPWKATEGPSY